MESQFSLSISHVLIHCGVSSPQNWCAQKPPCGSWYPPTCLSLMHKNAGETCTAERGPPSDRPGCPAELAQQAGYLSDISKQGSPDCRKCPEQLCRRACQVTGAFSCSLPIQQHKLASLIHPGCWAQRCKQSSLREQPSLPPTQVQLGRVSRFSSR